MNHPTIHHQRTVGNAIVLMLLFLFCPTFGAQCQGFFSAKLTLNSEGKLQEVAQTSYDFNGKIVDQTSGSFRLFSQKKYEFSLHFEHQDYQSGSIKTSEADYRRKNWTLRAIPSGKTLHQEVQLTEDNGKVTITTQVKGKPYENDALQFELLNEKGLQMAALRVPYLIESPDADPNITANLIVQPSFKVFLLVSQPRHGQRPIRKEVVWNTQNPVTIDLKMDQDARIEVVIEQQIRDAGQTYELKATAKQNYGFTTNFYWDRKYAAVGTRPQLTDRNMMAHLKQLSSGTTAPSRERKFKLRDPRQPSARPRQGGAVTTTEGKPTSPARASKQVHKMAISVGQQHSTFKPFIYYVNFRITK